MTTILLLLLLAIPDGTPQQPRDGVRPATSGSSRLAGVVVTDERTPRPVRRAIVTIAGSALGMSRSTITDDNGGFVFDGLPAGRFTVTAARRAYLTSAFGASYPGDAGTPITLTDANRVEDVRIVLPKGAVLTGVITDSAGTPIPALSVTVYRVSEASFERAGEDVTDDRGIYRVYGLRPGEYMVAAAPRVSGTGGIGVRSEREVDALLSALQRRTSGATTTARPGETGADPTQSPAERPYDFAQFYYPGTAVPAEATRIPVAAGDERGNLDFSVGVVPTATITGSVTGLDGQPAPDVQLSVVPLGPPVTILAGVGMTGPARTGPDGSFTRSNVTPGTYRILARRMAAAPPRAGTFTASAPVAGRGATAEWAMTEVTVNGDDIQGISLTLQPGLQLAGRIVFEGTSEIPRSLSAVRVTLTPATTSARTINVAPVPAKADGTIEITNLLPGSYQFGLTLPADIAEHWWLRSATSGGRDVLDVPLELSAGAQPHVVFTLSDRRPSLSGVVHDTNDRPTAAVTVLVFSADRAHWRRGSRRVHLVRPATDGAYRVTDIPPGEYLIASVPRVTSEVWHEPAFLERLAPNAARVVIGEGEQKTHDVRLSSSRR